MATEAKRETHQILVCADRSLKKLNSIPIVAGSVDVDNIQFTFEEMADWQSLTLMVYFTNTTSKITDMVGLTNPSAPVAIPPSVTQDAGFIGVAIQGVRQTGQTVNQRAATKSNPTIMTVVESGLGDYEPGPEDPITPSLLEQVAQDLEAAEAATTRAWAAADAVLEVFTGATEDTAGTPGQVPAPAAGETDLVLTGNAEWTDVHDLIPDKADIDGYYELLTAGAADNLTGRGDGVSASFLYRTAGGSEDIADGVATVKAIYGNTVGWNQLVDPT